MRNTSKGKVSMNLWSLEGQGMSCILKDPAGRRGGSARGSPGSLPFPDSKRSHLLPVLFPPQHLSETEMSSGACLWRDGPCLWPAAPGIPKAGSPV